MTAEQFVDSVSALTGEWRVLTTSKAQPGAYARDWRFKPSSLSSALGRPTRDLAVTERINDPTTLQMLELVNGQTLATLLHELGHHHDRMTTKLKRDAVRGESYAEAYAKAYTDRIWSQYREAFGAF